MTVPEKVAKLVERFEEQRDDYRSARYNETLLRRDFLDPFFTALGWDVDNRKGYSERFREVIHEYGLRVRGGTQAVDYCFRLGREPIFLVEAKKPAVDIRREVGPAYQLRNYGWNLKLPVSILTDFEEFAVYDCRGEDATGQDGDSASDRRHRPPNRPAGLRAVRVDRRRDRDCGRGNRSRTLNRSSERRTRDCA